MNWQKYTLDEWLLQFGAWCNLNIKQKTGNLPKINNTVIFDDVCHNTNRYECHISDAEAYAINQLLCSGKRVLPYEMGLLIENKVNRKSLRAIGERQQLRADKVFDLVNNAKYLLLGLNPNLILDCCDKK